MGRGRSTTAEYTPVSSQPVGIYGWRKRCLYAFILFLMVVMIMNLALTIWILRVMNFSIDGMGQLKITPKGVRIEGEAEFVRSLYAQDIKTRPGHPLYVTAARDIHLQARDKNNKKVSSLRLNDTSAVLECDNFEVTDKGGNRRLLVTKDEVIVSTDEVVYSGRASFDGSVETPSLRGPQSESLVVESESSAVKLTGLGGVYLKAPAGVVDLHADDDIRLHSKYGSIMLDSKRLFFKNLATITPNTGGGSQSGSQADVFQLCMCETGQLFLSAPTGDCRASNSICKPNS